MPDLSHELRCAESIARLAGQHILRERDNHLKVSLKGQNDLVTNVDRSTEKLIVDLLHHAFPGDRIVGEEFGAREAVESGSGERTWFIDPIDGTQNFAHGIPLFCVSIGFQIQGRTTAAVVYDPSRDELFSAAEGGGAHLNGASIEVSQGEDLSAALLVTGFPLECTEQFDWTMKQFNLMTRSCRGIRRLGSAAIDLAYVAAGRMEGFWEYGLSTWDTAAGCLLVTEAGGEVTDMNGDAFHVEAPGILATNGHLHPHLLRELRSVI